MNSFSIRLPEHITVRSTNADLKMLFDRNTGVMYELNDTASVIVDEIENDSHTRDSLINALVAKYDVTPEIVAEDLDSFLADFAQAGIVAVDGL